MSRLRSSCDSDSQVKSGCFSSNSGRYDTLLGFFRGGPGACSPDKNKKSRSSKLLQKQSSILAPPIYFYYLFSFKSFTVH